MTAGRPGDAGVPPEPGIPDGGAAEREVDVRALAARQPPQEGAWMRVTAAEARRGGVFTAVLMPGSRLLAGGGDVLVQVTPSPGWWTPGGTLVADVRVWAAVGGRLLLVAGWNTVSLDRWPEAVRCSVVFARGAFRELRDHGADACSPGQVSLIAVASAVPAPFPVLPAREGDAG